MKTTPRKFVVEFKSSRRMVKTKTDTIWGDLDLKAIAREWDEQAPPLCSTHAPNPSVVETTASADLIDVATSEDQTDLRDFKTETPPPMHVEVSHPATAASSQIQENLPASRPRTQTVRKRKNGAKPIPVVALTNTAASRENLAMSHDANPITFDELAMLDAENKQLKRLLANQLRAQNLQLTLMLERFGRR